MSKAAFSNLIINCVGMLHSAIHSIRFKYFGIDIGITCHTWKRYDRFPYQERDMNSLHETRTNMPHQPLHGVKHSN